MLFQNLIQNFDDISKSEFYYFWKCPQTNRNFEAFFISKNRRKSLKSEKSYINAILPYFYIFVIKWIFLLIQKVKFCSFFQRDMRDA